ncbi:MAG: exodeoxyribonuclease VII small subunit [Elusimicrobia bacterium]|nr:exodeoxyribonuclease VII small subunit [Elusimicrobiota bacterium]
MSKKDISELSFEQALDELEEISDRLSEGMLPLEESINLFERGVELKNLCSKKLETAEKKIKILSDDGKDGLKEEDFDE